MDIWHKLGPMGTQRYFFLPFEEEDREREVFLVIITRGHILAVEYYTKMSVRGLEKLGYIQFSEESIPRLLKNWSRREINFGGEIISFEKTVIATILESAEKNE